jgi:hypothetical protein
LNLGCRGAKPATNRLSYSTAFPFSYYIDEILKWMSLARAVSSFKFGPFLEKIQMPALK